MRPLMKIGALIIGQSPRPDLVEPLSQQLSGKCQILQLGALDGMTSPDIPTFTEGVYPLTTRLKDGVTVTVDEGFLAPKLQRALDELEDKGAIASLLLCAGTFANLKGTRPLFKPFDLGRDLLRQMGLGTIGVIAPFPEQEQPVRERWQAAGFRSTVWTADVTRQNEAFKRQLRSHISRDKLECIVLDYVGHHVSHVNWMQQVCGLPVIDLGQLAIAMLASTLGAKDREAGKTG